MAAFQLTLLLLLLFKGADFFNVPEGVGCFKYKTQSSSDLWNATSHRIIRTADVSGAPVVQCSDFKALCPDGKRDCYEELQTFPYGVGNQSQTAYFRFEDLESFEDECLECKVVDHTHNTIIFNTFIFCQIFNIYSSRMLFNELNFFSGLETNPIFLVLSICMIGCQIFLIELGGEFVQTTGLNLTCWLGSIGLAALTFPIAVLMRLLCPIQEDPDSFFQSEAPQKAVKSEMNNLVAEVSKKEEGSVRIVEFNKIEQPSLRSVEFNKRQELSTRSAKYEKKEELSFKSTGLRKSVRINKV